MEVQYQVIPVVSVRLLVVIGMEVNV